MCSPLDGQRDWVRKKTTTVPGVRTQRAAARAASKSTLVLVESPAKARKIGQYLGPGYEVHSHVPAPASPPMNSVQ